MKTERDLGSETLCSLCDIVRSIQPINQTDMSAINACLPPERRRSWLCFRCSPDLKAVSWRASHLLFPETRHTTGSSEGPCCCFPPGSQCPSVAGGLCTNKDQVDR